MGFEIGIDLGTTFSLVGVVDESERPRVVANRFDKPLTPSVIYFDSGEPLVGNEAKEMQALGEQQVACFFKRNMGDPNYALTFGNQTFSATDLSAILLKTLKADAEASLGKSISQAVITVPAYFNNFQREATIQAGQMAGLEVLSIVNEPTAAALAYGMHRQSGEQTVLVYDLGGGTFDITIVRITPESIDVIATSGDHELGGKDWDDRIATYLAQRFKEDHGVDPLEDSMSFNDLLVRCENAKRQLSSRKSARVTISHGGEKEGYELARHQFEQMTQDLMERTQNLTEEVLKDAELNWNRVDGVLLVGGSTRMPMVWEYVERMCGKKPLAGVNVDQAVALGAAIQAHMDTAQATGFTLPGVKRKQDIMSHSLGMAAENEDRSRYINSIIIPKNKPIPCEEKRPYQLRTVPGGENTLEVYMLQGESERPLECVVLGKYVFSGITHVAGKPAEIEIGYAYDRNGVVKVVAVERSTVKSLTMSVEPVPEDLSWLDSPPEDEQIETTFDPSSLKLIVSAPGYDDIGQVIKTLDLPLQDYVSPVDLSCCDIFFLNCGTERHPDAITIRKFVEQGGCLYASDLTDRIIDDAFPGFINYKGQIGIVGTISADVLDDELRPALGNKINIEFDMPSWAVINTVSGDVRVILCSSSNQKPLMVSFNYRAGNVFYTCFHNHAQTSDTETLLLQILVLKQISAVSGIPIAKIAQVITQKKKALQITNKRQHRKNRGLLKLLR